MAAALPLTHGWVALSEFKAVALPWRIVHFLAPKRRSPQKSRVPLGFASASRRSTLRGHGCHSCWPAFYPDPALSTSPSANGSELRSTNVRKAYRGLAAPPIVPRANKAAATSTATKKPMPARGNLLRRRWPRILAGIVAAGLACFAVGRVALTDFKATELHGDIAVANCPFPCTIS